MIILLWCLIDDFQFHACDLTWFPRPRLGGRDLRVPDQGKTFLATRYTPCMVLHVGKPTESEYRRAGTLGKQRFNWVSCSISNDEHVIFAEQSIGRFDSLQMLSCVLSLERILSIQLSEMFILCVFHICPAWMDMNKMLPRLSFFMWDLVGLVMQEPCYNLQAAHHLHLHWTQQTWFWLSQIVTSPCTRVYGVHMKLIFRKKLESLFWLQGAGIGNVGIWMSDYCIIENQRMWTCLACGPLTFPHIMHLDTYPHIILFWQLKH